MAGTATGTASESGGRRSFDGISSGQSCQSSEALAEFRSSEQVENGVPSTSPPYWDSDDDDDCGPKPSELYGKYTWKIDKFSQINKRELRSNAFEVGGYKWYILIYPQGCEVCNHLSLFLCVANHDKLLPGWSHFAQFTIAVVNKDPKKSKYSDTLHRFLKKEHDWGWKKFMELSKVLDGFIDADTLIIKAQVQVIRERADRPFRCLDCQYRRELVRVYLTNVEQICRRFVEERRVKLGKLTEDKARWSSFCAFWLEIDNNSRRRISREKMDTILRVVVKQFFIEKEVTSTLVMDSLYSGLKALEGQTGSKKSKGKLIDAEELPVPIVRIEKDTFVLVDDVLQLLERTAIEPLPPKDDKGPQNRTKDGGSAEDFSKDSIERDERRLTELGRRTIEIFVLAHLFSKIEVAHQEAVALKRQEELIREEAVWMAETEQKAKRCPTEKEKKLKKKQVKQKRINRKGKDKVKDDKPDVAVHDHLVQENSIGERNGIMTEVAEYVLGRPDTLEDASDVSDSVDFLPEILQPDTDDRDASPVNWNTDTSDVYHPTVASHSELSSFGALQDGMREMNSQSVVDDSSSTCSTDSVLSVAMNGPGEWNSLPNKKSQKSPSRGRNQRVRATSDSTVCVSEVCSQPPEVLRVAQPNDASGSCKSETETEMVVRSLQERIKELEQHMVKKEEVEVSLRRELGTNDQIGTERPSKDKGTGVPSSLSSSSKNLPLAVQVKSASKTAGTSDTEIPSKDKGTGVPSSPSSSSKNLPSAVQVKSVSKTSGDTVFTRKPSSDSPPGEEISSLQINSTPKSDTQKAAVPEPTENPSAKQVTVMSRPLTAPIIPGPRPIVPVVSMVQTTPLLERSVSAAGRLGPDLSHVTHSYVPLSYRNAITGTSVTASSAGFTQPQSPSSSMNPLWSSYATPAVSISSPVFLGRSSERMEPNSIKPTIPFEMLNRDVLQNGPHWTGGSLQRNSSRSIHYDSPSLHEDINDLYFRTSEAVHTRSQDHFPIGFPACASGSRSHEFPACTSGRQSHGVSTDEFPHLDIINDLLNDEHGITKAARAGTGSQSFSNGPHHLNRQFTFPRDIGMLNDTGPSTSFGRFERTRSYQDDVFQRGHGSLGVHFDSLHDMVPQTTTRPYVDGQIDGSILNQWQISGPDLSYLSLRNAEVDGYQYRFPDYSNLACSDNGYTVFPPSNGH